jgi:4-hydroxy-3-polyprenylbenzoate decarboxylase
MTEKTFNVKGAVEVFDLRSVIRLMEATPGQLIKTDKEVDPHAELAGVYKPIGSRTPTDPIY